MWQVGSPISDFRLTCVEPRTLHESTYQYRRDHRGWLALIFYPRDFSFVCPTELMAFSDRAHDFEQLGCRLIGASIDSAEAHQEWITVPANRGGVAGIRFPLASDPEGKVAKLAGAWNEEQQLPNRGLFLIDPDGRLQYSVIHNLHVGRSVDETLRVLRALQTGGLCPAAWTGEDGTLDAAGMLTQGRVIGHYRLREVLGNGSFGTVFLAWDLRLQRQVALKVLRQTHERAREALLDEARAAASVNHPSVCTIYAVEELDQLPVIVMRYVEGGSLSDRLRDQSLTPDKAKRLVKQIAEGLAAAHERGVVHGDLKPANILLDEQGGPCIVDFGLSHGRAVVASQSKTSASDELEVDETILTATGTWLGPMESRGDEAIEQTWDMAKTVSWHGGSASLIGTPAYMSPEQAIGKPPGPLSDVFALGLILAELLSGRRVLDERSVYEILHFLRDEDIAKRVLERLADDFPRACLSMLSRDPTDRPTARQVASALDAT